MSQLEEFISTLTDSELAIFIAYQYDGFIDSSKQKLKNAILNRGLTSEKLFELFNKGLNKPNDNSLHFCPRCHSTKYYAEIDHDLKTVRYYSYEVAVDTLRCQLCGYNPDKEKPKNLFDAIKLIFKSNKNIRIPKREYRVFKGL